MRAKFGQNFLVDRNWQNKIVEAFQPNGGFAEIGPGKGAITQKLAQEFSGFSVFEIDEAMLEFHESSTTYQCIHQDFLKWDYQLDGQPVEGFSLISNLPYESSTAIMTSVCFHADQIDHFVFMFQREVADRIQARPATRDFGSLSVFVQGQYEMKSLGIVPPTAFRPAPKVQSKVLVGHRRKGTPHPVTREYSDFLFKCFSMKRKTLRNCLRKHYSERLDVDQVMEKLKLSENIRAEAVELDRWPDLFKEVSSFVE